MTCITIDGGGTKTVYGNDVGKECKFPFVYLGKSYDKCTDIDNNGTLWCATTFLSYEFYRCGPYVDKWGACPNECDPAGKKYSV